MGFNNYKTSCPPRSSSLITISDLFWHSHLDRIHCLQLTTLPDHYLSPSLAILIFYLIKIQPPLKNLLNDIFLLVASVLKISETPTPVLALVLKCELSTLLAYLNKVLIILLIRFCFFKRYLSILKIAFVPCYYYWSVLRQVLLQLFHPLLHPLERIQVSDVINYQCTYNNIADDYPFNIWYIITFCSSVIHWIQGMIPLLTRSVPNYEFDLLGLDLNHSFQAAGIKSTLLILIKFILAKPHS